MHYIVQQHFQKFNWNAQDYLKHTREKCFISLPFNCKGGLSQSARDDSCVDRPPRGRWNYLFAFVTDLCDNVTAVVSVPMCTMGYSFAVSHYSTQTTIWVTDRGPQTNIKRSINFK